MFSNRLGSIKPFIVMEILEQALAMEEKGIDVIHFEIGEPDFDTPEKIINGCYEDIIAGKTHYTHSLGLLELRNALSKYKERTRGTLFNPKTEIMVTGGTSPAFLNILGTLIDPGDEIIITDPGYPCYANFIQFFGGKPVYLPIYEEDEFNLDINALKHLITKKTKMLILNSPSNPTGQIIPDKTLDGIAKLMLENKFWTISDEIYSELTYDKERAPSLSEKKYSECHDRLIVLDGFSKFWAMTGWRIGYIIAPANLIKAMMPIQQNFSICAPSISQTAAIHALECDVETQKMLDIYRKRRKFIVNRISAIPKISCLVPKGAFYLFCNIKKLEIGSIELSKRLLEKAHIAVTPGVAFGKNGEGFIRISYPTDIDNISEGMDRLKIFINSID
ncbi:MAG: aminotransferase class I/II-fold pyridoxal phosphate-dependent enzyme [Candidatus Lokiarchaeota archaeon]|nr:aminotransferase class I/II-fold pyridoxal phosphate-dependent enzyme [Candidatus Lokiarchaeota archaeon]